MSVAYRIREATVEVCNGYTCHHDRRFMAERRVSIFGMISFWWPVIDAGWRQTPEAAMQDMRHDSEMRKPGSTRDVDFDGDAA